MLPDRTINITQGRTGPRYLQDLWDRIAKGPGQLPVPKSHLSLARERLAEYRRDPSLARPAHDVLRDLANPDR